MDYHVLGDTGLKVSAVCLGTMTFGNEADEATSRVLMDRAMDAGINFFDAAHNYNKGVTEEIVGRWLSARRREIILTSKVYFPAGGGRNDQGLSRRNIVQSVERSLTRLQTDYIDLLYLHHWDENTHLEHSLGALDDLVRAGKVLSCGVSNFAAWQVMKAISVAELKRLTRLSVMQPMYSLVKRQVEVELLPLAAEEKLAVVPYNAIAAGMLTGKYLAGGAGRLTEAEMYAQRYANADYSGVVERFVAHARAQGHSPAALAVAWVMAHPLVTSTLVGARNVDQFNDTLKAIDIRLTPEQRDAITALSIDPPLATDREPMAAMNKRGW
jgi:aryl-alcohol dehydrogenase-like predicted oxidoreductase